MLQRNAVIPLAVALLFVVSGFMSADWSVWVEGCIGIVVFLLLYFTRETSFVGTSWRDPQRWFLLLLVAAFVASIWTTNAYATLRGYIYLVVAFALFRAGRSLEPRHGWRLLIWLHIIATGFSVWALVDQVLRQVSRAEGFLGNANALGAYLAVALPIGIAVSLRATGKLRAVAWVGVGLITAALLRTFSLTAYFSLLVGGVVVIVVSTRARAYLYTYWKRILFWFAIGLACAFVALVSFRAVEQRSLVEGLRLDKVITAQHFTSSFQQRWRFLEATTAMIADQPLVGFGMGSYQNTYQRYSSTAYELPRYAHNHLFELTAEAGIVVGVVFLLLIVFIFRRVFQNLRTTENVTFNVLLAWAIFGSIASAFVDFGWHFPAVWVSFWLFVGWATQRQEKIPSTKGHKALAVCILSIGFVILLRGIGVVAAFTPFQRAEIALTQGQFAEAIAQYNCGLRYDPNPNMAGRLAVAHWAQAKGNVDELTTAQQLVGRILQFNPYDHFAYQLRGRIAFSAKDFVVADVAFARAVELDRGFHLDITIEYANFLLAQGRSSDAYTLVSNALHAIQPDAWSVSPTYASDLRTLQAYQEQAHAALATQDE